MAYHDIAGTIEGVNDATQMEYDQDDEFGELGARRKKRRKGRHPWVPRRCYSVVHRDTIKIAAAYRNGRLHGADPVAVMCAKLAYKALRRGDCRNADKYAALAENIYGALSAIEDQLALKY